jgi:hypothetical protein
MLIIKHYRVQIFRDFLSIATKLALDAVIWDIVAGFG